MGTVTALPLRTEAMTWDVAAHRFLHGRDLSPGTRRVYGMTLERLGKRLPAPEIADLSIHELHVMMALAYPMASASSWNRHIATVRSFLAYCARQGWVEPGVASGLERRREVVDYTRALTRAQVDALLSRKDVAVRERCLWRLLYESAARANEILRLNIEDFDFDQRRAVTVRKAGAIDIVHYASGSARLLPYVIDGRERGPLFLSTRPVQARRAPAATDIDPVSGLARLSYGRAAEMFRESTNGWTLHQLRHSAISHLAEDGVPLPLLMAKSRHESLRTLQRYARPSVEAVGRLTAEHDSARRR